MFLLIALHDLATDKGKRSQPQVPQKDFQFAFNSTMHMLNRQSDIKRFSQKRSTFCFLILTMIMFGHLKLRISAFLKYFKLNITEESYTDTCRFLS